MEVLGVVLGIPPLVQLCAQGYRSLVTAVKDSAQLHAQLRLQEARLIHIVRSWGLNVDEASGDVTVTARQIPDDACTQLLVEQARIFEEPVKEAMRQIAAILFDSDILTARYGLASRGSSEQDRESSPQLEPVHKKLKNPIKRIRWSLQDKASFTHLVQSLASFNDVLETFVPIIQRQTMAVGVAVQLASTPSSVEELEELRAAAERYKVLQQTIDLKSFCLQTDESSSLGRPARGIPRELTPVGSHAFSCEEARSLATFHKKGGFGEDDASCDVIVEWKVYDEKASVSRKDMVRERVEKLASLLRLAAACSPNLRILDCIKTFDDRINSRIGLVLQIPNKPPTTDLPCTSFVTPPPASPMTLRCVTLYSLLGSDKSAFEVPDLGSRIALAGFLARGLLQLHAAGWLHKGMRSDNILFFHRGTRPSSSNNTKAPPDISEPYIAGFDYSRPDGDVTMTETLVCSHEYQDYYRHPDSITDVGAGNPAPSRFRRAFDVHSLGCVLLEIGLWRRIQEFWKLGYTPHKFHSRLLKVYSRDLARHCGKRYEAAVRLCLRGLANECTIDGENSCADLQEFYTDVVCQLQSCIV
ncbi:hypothetical protein ACJ41O_014805 [Fusarium nematophilum]